MKVIQKVTHSTVPEGDTDTQEIVKERDEVVRKIRRTRATGETVQNKGTVPKTTGIQSATVPTYKVKM